MASSLGLASSLVLVLACALLALPVLARTKLLGLDPHRAEPSQHAHPHSKVRLVTTRWQQPKDWIGQGRSVSERSNMTLDMALLIYLHISLLESISLIGTRLWEACIG
jgi:hypothetical protein